MADDTPVATPTEVDTTLFGNAGVADPVLFHPGLDAIKRKVNFAAAKPTSAGTYALFGLPKAFVVTGVFLEETKKCTAGTIGLIVADSADSSSDVTILSGTAVGGSALVRGAAQLSTAVVLDEGAIVSLVPTATSGDTFDEGEVNVVVYGYTPYGDGLDNIVTPGYRESGQTQTNVAGVDPWQDIAVRRA